jgi:hypothetical protein
LAESFEGKGYEDLWFSHNLLTLKALGPYLFNAKLSVIFVLHDVRDWIHIAFHFILVPNQMQRIK